MAKNDLWWVLHFSSSNIFERSLCLNHLVYVYCSLFLPLWIKFSHSNHCLQHSVMIWPYFKLHSFKGFSLSRKSHWIINNIHILKLWLIYYFFSYVCNFCSHFEIDIIGKCIYDTYFNHYIWRPRIWQFSHIKPFGATCHVWYILHFLANFYPLWVSVTYSLKSMHHIYFVQRPCNSFVVSSNMCINEIHHRHTYVYTYSFDLKAFA